MATDETVDLTLLRLAAAFVAGVSLVALVRSSWPIAALVAVDAALRGWATPSVAPSRSAAAFVVKRLSLRERGAFPAAPQRTSARVESVCAAAAGGLFFFHRPLFATVLIGAVVLFATLEAALSVCLPCIAHEIVAGRGCRGSGGDEGRCPENDR